MANGKWPCIRHSSRLQFFLGFVFFLKSRYRVEPTDDIFDESIQQIFLLLAEWNSLSLNSLTLYNLYPQSITLEIQTLP